MARPSGARVRQAVFSGLLVVAAVAAPSDASVPPALWARLTATKITLGSTVYVQGSIIPHTATTRVVLQRRINGRWVDRVAAPLDRATGSFRIPVRPSSSGTYTMRVRSGGGSVVTATFWLKVSPPVVRYAKVIRPTSADVASLVDFGWRQTNKVVDLEWTFSADERGQAFDVDRHYEPGWSYLFLCGTRDWGYEMCVDGIEILVEDLDEVPGASLAVESGLWVLRGRFQVTELSGPHMGIYSLALRAVPAA